MGDFQFFIDGFFISFFTPGGLFFEKNCEALRVSELGLTELSLSDVSLMK